MVAARGRALLQRRRLAGTPEDAEDLGRVCARAAEPVRDRGVEGGNLAGSEHRVLVAEDEAHLTGQDVDPFVPVVCSWFWRALAGGDDDLPRLHSVGLPGQRDHVAPLDA